MYLNYRVMLLSGYYSNYQWWKHFFLL